MKTKKAGRNDAMELNHQLYKDGCLHYDNSKFQKAIGQFKAAIEYIPEDYQAWMALGNCYDKIKKPNRAEKCFLKALMYAPVEDQEGIIFNLGNSLFDQSRFIDSIEQYKKLTPGSDIWVKAQRNIKLAKKKLKEN